MSHHIVELNNLSYSYPDGWRAVDDISLRITHGESVGIIGANGAGKSTLMMLISGAILPEQGEVRIGEIPVTKKTLQHIRQTVGLVFQNPDDQLFMSSIFNDIAFGPRNLGLDEKEVEIRVNKALEKMDITHLKTRPPYKLSAGEKRSAAIATVLSMQPDILVMDEPSSMLDPKSRRSLIKTLSGFFHTKIIATHDLDMVLESCTRVILINKGQLIADGSPGEILSDENLLSDNGLELPLTLQNCQVCNPRDTNL